MSKSKDLSAGLPYNNYLSTEFFFDGRVGSGLRNDHNKAVLMRAVKDTKDSTGGINHLIPTEKIVETAIKLTR